MWWSYHDELGNVRSGSGLGELRLLKWHREAGEAAEKEVHLLCCWAVLSVNEDCEVMFSCNSYQNFDFIHLRPMMLKSELLSDITYPAIKRASSDSIGASWP